MATGNAPFTSRIPKYFYKKITFTGAAGLGATGTVAIGTVTGAIWLQAFACRCLTLLTSSGGTVELGVASNTAALIAQTTATDIDASEFWRDATPEFGISPMIMDQAIKGNLILTVGTAAVSAGVLEFYGYWLPLSPDGQIA